MSRIPTASHHRRVRSLAAGTALLTGLVTAPPMAAQSGEQRSCGIPDFPAPTLCARAGLDTLRATYIVLLDESGSMRPLWGQVKEAVGTFVRAVPDGDVLDIRLFSGGVQRLNVPAPASSRLADEWARQLAALPAPAGARTDLGAALKEALDVIAAAPADQQHFVYVLTDGAQDPGPGSPYPAGGGGDWPKLRAEAHTLAGARPVSFAILRLTEQADAQGLLAGALPRPDVVPAMTSAELRRWFETEARSVAVRKLQLRIASERRLPALLDSGPTPLRLGDAAGIRRIQLRSTTDAVLVDSASVELPGGARVTVHPNADLATASVTSIRPRRPWYLPPARITGDLDTIVPVRVRLEPAGELRLIGDSAGPLQDSLRIVLPIVGAGFLQLATWWVVAIALVVSLVLLARSGVRATHRPRLSGRLLVEYEQGVSETIELGPLDTASHRVVAPSGRTVAVLEARNERGRTALWVLPDGEPVSIGGRPLRAPERILSVIRLEHREATFHYFPS